MKFNELTIRELRAQAKAACHKVVRNLPEDKKSMFQFLTVDFISPMAVEDTEMNDFEYFCVLGHIDFTDKTTQSFKAELVWLGDGCDLAWPDENDSVQFIDVDINSLELQY